LSLAHLANDLMPSGFRCLSAFSF